MFYSFSTIPFLIVIHHLQIHISNAIPSEDDKMLIAFVSNDQKMQMSEYSKHKYETYLGFMYFMRMNMKCDKIDGKFEEYERTKCQKYRKYLDILYEYLYREYAGILTVKPKFVFEEQIEIEIEGPLIYAMNCLAIISWFYFTERIGKCHEYKLNELFTYHFKTKLLNANRLNYGIKLENEQKLPINELILQLAIDTANEWQTNESLDVIIQQKFDKNLEKMFKKAEERRKENSFPGTDLDDKHLIIVQSKFDDQRKWTEDALFTEFVKGLATNSEKFFKMAKEYSNYLSRRKEKGNVDWWDRGRITYGLYEIEKMKEQLTQKYEAQLGVVYLMRKNWHCDQIGKEFKENCQKYRKYLDILYEYLFRLYAEAKNPKLSKQLPTLKKPIFTSNECHHSLIRVIIYLSVISKCFWQKGRNGFYELNLENEVECNYEIEEEENWFHKNIQKRNQLLNGQMDIERIREEFGQKMEKCMNNAKKEKAKLEKAIENAKANNEENVVLNIEYKDKFLAFSFIDHLHK